MSYLGYIQSVLKGLNKGKAEPSVYFIGRL